MRLLSEAKPTYGVSHAELEDQLWKLEQKTEVHSKNTCNMATLAFLPAGHFSIATQNSPSLHSLLSATTESPISLPWWCWVGVIYIALYRELITLTFPDLDYITADYRLDHLGRLSMPVPVSVHRGHRRVSRRGSGQCGVVSTSHRSRLWTWLPSTALTSTRCTPGRSDRWPFSFPSAL